MANLNYEIADDLWQKFKIKAVEQGKTLKDQLAEAIDRYLDDGEPKKKGRA